eukprot:1996421-Alexandrium_andersonii.AAC.1
MRLALWPTAAAAAWAMPSRAIGWCGSASGRCFRRSATALFIALRLVAHNWLLAIRSSACRWCASAVRFGCAAFAAPNAALQCARCSPASVVGSRAHVGGPGTCLPRAVPSGRA